jgi:hypothetical protein
MEFAPVVHVSAVSARRVSVGGRLPWLYAIIASAERAIYIGETFDQAGLVTRLLSHFGPYSNSTLKQRAAAVLRRADLKPPILIFAARLPMHQENFKVEGSSRQVRLLLEGLLHQMIVESYLPKNPGWALLSSPTGVRLTETKEILATAQEIYHSLTMTLDFLWNLQDSSQFHLVIVDPSRPIEKDTRLGLHELVEECEIAIFTFLRKCLETQYGEDWWTEGVPANIRMKCAQRQEEEGASQLYPKEAFLTLIELRDIATKNWSLVGNVIETIGDGQGKERGTAWLLELNDVRKLLAHPLKRLHGVIQEEKKQRIYDIHKRITSAIVYG